MFQFLSSNPSFFPLFLFLFLSSAASTSPMHHLPDESVETNETVLNKHGNGGNTSTTLLLAPHRTNRPDIFNHFQPYTAGWNLTNYHYLSSVISSAVPLIVAAVAWLVVFGVCLQLICFCYCCCPSSTPPPHAYSKSAYVSSFIFLFLFTIAAIGGCLILYSGQGKLHESTSQTLHFLVNQAHLTALNLREVSDYFDTTKQVGLAADLSFLPPDFGDQIDHVKTKLTSASLLLSNKTDHNSHNIQQGLDTMRLALIIVSAVMLSVTFAGFLCSLLGIQCLVYFLVVIGWILVACTFILCAGFLFLHNCNNLQQVTLQDANAVWKNYTCEASSWGRCVSVGRMTPTVYTQLGALVNVTYGLYHYGPFLSDLVDCTFVRETFSAITHNYCPSLSLFTKWIYFGLLLVSVAVMFSLILWIIYDTHHRHRRYTKTMRYIVR
ncbi:hypothetical protein Ahy_B01g055274 [Arachis hypogaea]|uniref:Protein tweety homolog n=1 Tax=Arachis hypogaea TaxID=3818 RepID=A0A445AVR8_ARAHY|nr:hypothetical protein Ahy_B01g055274 [Arachis hypogaea]